MSDPQAQMATPQRSRQKSKHSLADGVENQGGRHPSVRGDSGKLMDTEKFYSILSFNWKEENLLKKKLSFLESMKKHEANAWLMEQKVFYKRCHSKLQRSELAHARLLGNKDLVKRLTSKNALSSSTSALVDESEAAVKAIVQGRGRWEKNRPPLGLSLDTDGLFPPLRRGLLRRAEAQAAPRAAFKARPKEEDVRATGKISAPQREDESGRDSPQQTAQPKKLPAESRLPQEARRPPRGASSRLSGFPQSAPQKPVTAKASKGKLLKYLIYGGDRSAKRPKEKRPRSRNSLHSLENAQPTQMDVALKQAFLSREGAKYLAARAPSLLQPMRFQDHSCSSPLEEGSEGGPCVSGSGRRGLGKGRKGLLSEKGARTEHSPATRRDRRPFF